MAWSQFNYWRRDNWLEKPLTKVPKGSKEPLVWHQIERGDFDPSPYWDMADKEIEMFEKEMEDYKANLQEWICLTIKTIGERDGPFIIKE